MDSIDIDLSWWQGALLQDFESDVIVTTAGYGSGKTLASVLWCYARLVWNEGCDALYIEPTYRLIKITAIPAWREGLGMMGLTEGVHYTIYTSADNPRIVFCTGQTVFFISGERPEAIVGITTASHAVIDEAALCKEDVFRKTRARLRYHKAKKCQIFCPSTPEGMNWFSDEFDSDTLPGWEPGKDGQDAVKHIKVEEMDGTITTIKYRRFRATVYDNKHNLKPSYIPNLLNDWKFNQNYIDSYVFGYFRPFATGLAYTFKSYQHKIDNIEASPHKAIHLTWDFNICPQWVSIQRQSETNEWGHKKHFWAAVENANEGNEQLVEALEEFCLKHPRAQFRNTPVLVYGDSSGWAKSHKSKLNDYLNIKQYLRDRGYSQVELCAIKQNPLERTSVDAVNYHLDENTFRVCEKCDMVLKSATRTTWKNGERAKLDKPPGEHWTHPMDAVKYFFCALDVAKGRQVRAGRY